MAREMRIDGSFHAEYRKLEDRMRMRAEDDGDVFLPNVEPEGPVNYLLICMEPSLGRWARSPEQARSKVEAGFRNFLPSDETSILHFSIRRYLCKPTERYHITDLSKGAMLVKRAGLERKERYDRWYELLNEEIKLVGPDACIVAVGSKVHQYLKRKGFCQPFTQIIHYSGQAASARNAGIVGRVDDFDGFKHSISHDDLLATAQELLASASVPADIRDETLSKLRRFSLTISGQRLIFNYKMAFESIRSQGPVVP